MPFLVFHTRGNSFSSAVLGAYHVIILLRGPLHKQPAGTVDNATVGCDERLRANTIEPPVLRGKKVRQVSALVRRDPVHIFDMLTR